MWYSGLANSWRQEGGSSTVVQLFVEEAFEEGLRGWEGAVKESPLQGKGGEMADPCEKGRCGPDIRCPSDILFPAESVHRALQSSGCLR